MGIYAQYLEQLTTFDEITEERKKILSKISEIRGRDVLTFASDISKGKSPITIEYSDLLPVQDQLENLSGNAIDIILETPGGIAMRKSSYPAILHRTTPAHTK